MAYLRLFALRTVPFYPTKFQFIRLSRGKRIALDRSRYAYVAGLYLGLNLSNPDEWFRIDGGNDQLSRAFASQLTNNIIYNAPVTRIEQHAPGVGATFVKNGIKRQLSGDYLICTVPFSTLRDVEVIPPFSLQGALASGYRVARNVNEAS